MPWPAGLRHLRLPLLLRLDRHCNATNPQSLDHLSYPFLACSQRLIWMNSSIAEGKLPFWWWYRKTNFFDSNQVLLPQAANGSHCVEGEGELRGT